MMLGRECLLQENMGYLVANCLTSHTCSTVCPNSNKLHHSTLSGSPRNFIFLFLTIQLIGLDSFACFTLISIYQRIKFQP